MSHQSHFHGPFEIRTDEGGALDEVCLRSEPDIHFHMEQMSETSWWIGVEAGGVKFHIDIHSYRNVYVQAEEGVLDGGYYTNAKGKVKASAKSNVGERKKRPARMKSTVRQRK